MCTLVCQVLELERRLEQETQSRKKAEEAAQEALLKYELLGLLPLHHNGLPLSF